MINLFNTYIHSETINYIRSVLEEGFISEGEWNKKFEQELITLIGNQNLFTVNSGTSALHLSLILAGVNENDEVIIPSQTFVATGLAVLYCKAIPVFADIDLSTGNILLESIKKLITEKTKAIIPVHWAGYPCDLDEINALAKQYNITVIEDAAHAFLSEYKSKKIGSISDFTCFSFQAIKHLTTGDGGAITTKNIEDYKRGKKLRWFGIDKDLDLPNELGERQYNLNEIGYKYHMNNISAAIGLANLLNIEERIEKRRKLASIYFNELKNVSGIKLMNYKNDRKSSYWLFPILVEKRKEFIKMMLSNKINVSVVHQGIHKNRIFNNCKKDINNQTIFDEKQIHIPLHENLNEEDIYFIIETIKKGWL
jgi:perosamine synthetase